MKIICTNNIEEMGVMALTIGKVYDIIYYDELINSYRILNDNYQLALYSKFYFEMLRDENLKILHI